MNLIASRLKGTVMAWQLVSLVIKILEEKLLCKIGWPW
jgi:hypothetical protein